MPEIDRILDELQREYAGDPWHGSPLRQILDGIDAESASRHPLPGAHSIWELVLHVTAWKNEVRRRLTGAPAGEPEEGDWPTVGDVSDERWRDALGRLERAHELLLAEAARLPERQLDEPILDVRGDATTVTYYMLLHGLVQHDVYHAGQIALLKKGLRA